MNEKRGFQQSHSTGAYSKFDDKEQWIRISEGCPNHCPFCYEISEQIWYGIPEIVRSKVSIMDMNMLSFPQSLETIIELGRKEINGESVDYEFVCGIDWRYLTPEIAEALRSSRFRKIRLAWDWHYTDQFKIKKAIETLRKAGYRNRPDIMVFMICNWDISFDECMKKLNLCKYWGVQVSDCYFDGQIMPNVEPIGWTAEQIKTFRHEVRKHNQMVNFGCDPELAKQSDIGGRR